MIDRFNSSSRWRARVSHTVVILALAPALMAAIATSAQAATAAVGLGNASSFSVLGASTVTNTGPTSMSGDLGLSPGTSVTGAPAVGGTSHVADAVAVAAQSSLSTAYSDAAGRPSTVLASPELSGRTFTAGVYTASSSLLLSAGSVTLNAQGDPNAVFIFQVGSELTTGSATTVLLTNGAQPCNVFWQVGSSATLGTASRFIGTVMAQATITAKTSTTLDGRLLARTGAVNLDTNTITTSACAPGTTDVNPVATAPATTVTGSPTSTTPTATPNPTGTPKPTGTPTQTATSASANTSTPASAPLSGTAQIWGPSGPVSGPFAVWVTGRAIESVTFYLDGKRIGTVHATRGRSKFKITINPRKQSHRVHRVTARVKFKPASRTRTTKRRLTYRRHATAPRAPQFTG